MWHLFLSVYKLSSNKNPITSEDHRPTLSIFSNNHLKKKIAMRHRRNRYDIRYYSENMAFITQSGHNLGTPVKSPAPTATSTKFLSHYFYLCHCTTTGCTENVSQEERNTCETKKQAVNNNDLGEKACCVSQV